MLTSFTRRCLVLCAVAFPVTAIATEDRQAEVFGKALEAARNNQWATVNALQSQLGEHLVLQDYLDYHHLRTQLAKAPVDQVLAYTRKYDDSPLTISMRRLAMAQYAKQQRWTDLQAVSAGVPAPLALRCHYYQAMLGAERERALKEARQLWLSGESLPDACDPLFSALKEDKQLDDLLIWQRLLLATRAGNESLMRYLRSELSDTGWLARADTLLRLYREPMQVRYLNAADHHDALAVVVLERLADKNPEETRRLLPMLGKRLSLNEDQQRRISDRIAWFSSIRDIPENREWLDQYLTENSDQRGLEQRARRAVSEQNWDDVARWVSILPATERTSARWRYWLARAFEQRGDQESAQRYYQLAASARSFWGFLAADHLDVPPALNNRPAFAEDIALNERSERVLQRVALLLAIGEAGHAREEWLFLLRHLDDASQQDALADIALQRNWPHLAIETALHTGRHDVLDWRFPLAQQTEFERAAEKHQIDRWLLMAIARRESAFNPHARSHAGALGLMQLMPGTATDMARQSGVALKDAEAVFDPAINIDLGSRYLAGLMKRYGDNRILALAAYNAGPHRVDRWLEEAHTPFDVFIESIPFYETREYVQAVLAYRVILSRHEEDQPLVALLGERETARPYTPMQLAANKNRAP